MSFFDPYFFWILSPEEIAAFLAALWLNIFLIPILIFFDTQLNFLFPIIFLDPPPPRYVFGVWKETCRVLEIRGFDMFGVFAIQTRWHKHS